MHIEVDQSGKIGDTAVPTALALSNDLSVTLWISAAAKRGRLESPDLRVSARDLLALLKQK